MAGTATSSSGSRSRLGPAHHRTDIATTITAITAENRKPFSRRSDLRIRCLAKSGLPRVRKIRAAKPNRIAVTPKGNVSHVSVLRGREASSSAIWSATPSQTFLNASTVTHRGRSGRSSTRTRPASTFTSVRKCPGLTPDSSSRRIIAGPDNRNGESGRHLSKAQWNPSLRAASSRSRYARRQQSEDFVE